MCEDQTKASVTTTGTGTYWLTPSCPYCTPRCPYCGRPHGAPVMPLPHVPPYVPYQPYIIWSNT